MGGQNQLRCFWENRYFAFDYDDDDDDDDDYDYDDDMYCGKIKLDNNYMMMSFPVLVPRLLSM